jgi:LacI family transcriptional regulator
MVVTREDVAQAAKVAPSTVSRALSNSPLLSEATKQRVRAEAERLGYKVSQAGRRLAHGRSFVLGFAVPDRPGQGSLRLDYFTISLAITVETASQAGFDVVVHPYGAGPAEARRLASAIESHRMDACVVLGLTLGHELPSVLLEHQVPFVALGSNDPALEYPFVAFDSRQGYRAMVERAKSLGHTRALVIGGNPRYSNALEQKRSLEWAAAETGLDLAWRLEGNYSLRQSRQVLETFLTSNPWPSLIICANDRSAAGVYQVMHAKGVSPERVSVVGYDDEEITRLLWPPLASIRQPRAEAATFAVAHLIKRIEGERSTLAELLPTTFCDRPSLGESGF